MAALLLQNWRKLTSQFNQINNILTKFNKLSRIKQWNYTKMFMNLHLYWHIMIIKSYDCFTTIGNKKRVREFIKDTMMLLAMIRVSIWLLFVIFTLDCGNLEKVFRVNIYIWRFLLKCWRSIAIDLHDFSSVNFQTFWVQSAIKPIAQKEGSRQKIFLRTCTTINLKEIPLHHHVKILVKCFHRVFC